MYAAPIKIYKFHTYIIYIYITEQKHIIKDPTSHPHNPPIFHQEPSGSFIERFEQKLPKGWSGLDLGFYPEKIHGLQKDAAGNINISLTYMNGLVLW